MIEGQGGSDSEGEGWYGSPLMTPNFHWRCSDMSNTHRYYRFNKSERDNNPSVYKKPSDVTQTIKIISIYCLKF